MPYCYRKDLADIISAPYPSVERLNFEQELKELRGFERLLVGGTSSSDGRVVWCVCVASSFVSRNDTHNNYARPINCDFGIGFSEKFLAYIYCHTPLKWRTAADTC